MRTTSELRGEILEAARTEFAQYGLAGARIDRIAKEANASKERLYAHFGDKEALFREVVTTDGARFFRTVKVRPGDVPQFVGEVFDLALRRPEHVRMITWAQLEGLPLEPPRPDGKPLHEESIAAIEEAQELGLVAEFWDPTDLLVMLFSIGLAWAYSPGPGLVTSDRVVIARRRAAAVEAARRITSPARE